MTERQFKFMTHENVVFHRQRNERTTENFACNAYDESSLTARMFECVQASCVLALSPFRHDEIHLSGGGVCD